MGARVKSGALTQLYGGAKFFLACVLICFVTLIFQGTRRMTQPHYTDIVIVLDRSGSMAGIAKQTIEGFNQFLDEQRKDQDQSTVTLILFDDQYDVLHVASPLSEAKPLTRETFEPRGSTALLDAMGRTIQETGQRLAALPEEHRPEHVLFVTITDGQENSSKHFTHTQVADMIAHQRDVYKWQFVFLGANQDAIATASALSMNPDSALTYDATGEGSKVAWQELSSATSLSRMNWKKKLAGDLNFVRKAKSLISPDKA